MCEKKGLSYPPKHVFFRAFKLERKLEVWAAASAKDRMVLLQTYPIAAMSGDLGPKRVEGDGQVPEGIYRIDRFNPQSSYHLSLRVSYPNDADRHFSDPTKPGGDIHGNRVSIGCLAMTDDKIEEIYLLALAGRQAGVPIHIFPYRFGSAASEKRVTAKAALWDELKQIYWAFEKSRIVPVVTVNAQGQYRLCRS
jgi:murein L,D-transpeptidase YafK